MQDVPHAGSFTPITLDVNGRTHDCRVAPLQPLSETLRNNLGLTGTKVGCDAGDCGACTVAIGRVKNGKLVYEPANACILLVGQLHGCELVAVDDLSQDGVLHPVQSAMVKHHASQCGFCTPGFVMSLFALYHQGILPTRQQIVDQIAGAHAKQRLGLQLSAGLLLTNECSLSPPSDAEQSIGLVLLYGLWDTHFLEKLGDAERLRLHRGLQIFSPGRWQIVV